jgi:hypothetical protein
MTGHVDVTRMRRTTVVVARVVTWLLYVYVIVCEVLLAFGFVLRLFGANPTSEFTQFVYRSLERVMAPFRGIFAPVELGTTGNDVEAVLDTSILFAMLVYGVALLAIGALVDWLTHRIAVLDARREIELAEAARLADEQRARWQGAPPPRVVASEPVPADPWGDTRPPGV